ncbi:hypothetical protein BHE74_00055732 [Ensete ventricosum]|nr:hypothetical protein BHE74_00055732 [Ensete ventricosum]
MSDKRGSSGKHEEMELRRGPWTLEEDTLLMHYITCHGEGRWNLLAKCSGGHSSDLSSQLMRRTDNEIKNYWRTRVQKQARQLKVDPNSTMFRDALLCYWTPRLREQIIGSSQTLRPVDANTNTTTATDQAQQVLQSCRSYELPETESRSLSTSSCSVVLSQLPEDLSEFPSGLSSDELSGVTFDPFSSVCSMIDAYNFDTWDIAPVSASAPSHSASDRSNNVGSDGGEGLLRCHVTIPELRGESVRTSTVMRAVNLPTNLQELDISFRRLLSCGVGNLCVKSYSIIASARMTVKP